MELNAMSLLIYAPKYSITTGIQNDNGVVVSTLLWYIHINVFVFCLFVCNYIKGVWWKWVTTTWPSFSKCPMILKSYQKQEFVLHTFLQHNLNTVISSQESERSPLILDSAFKCISIYLYILQKKEKKPANENRKMFRSDLWAKELGCFVYREKQSVEDRAPKYKIRLSEMHNYLATK